MRTGAVGIAACVLSITTSAWGQSFEALLQECYALRTRDRSAAALSACQRAVAMSRNGRSLAQLGLTEMELGQWVDAANHVSEALGDPTQQVPERRRALDTAMAQIRPHVAELVIETNARDATVTLDGRAVEGWARPVYLGAGSVRLEVRPREGAAIARTVTLTAGGTSRESVQFAPARTVEVQMQVPARDRVVGPTPERPSPVAVTLPPRVASNGSTQRVLAWTAGGLALVGVGLGIAGWQLREGEIRDYEAQCPGTDFPETTYAGCSASYAALTSATDQWGAMRTAGLVAGGIFAVASAVLFATAPGAERRVGRAVRCGGGPGVVGVGCEVGF